MGLAVKSFTLHNWEATSVTFLLVATPCSPPPEGFLGASPPRCLEAAPSTVPQTSVDKSGKGVSGRQVEVSDTIINEAIDLPPK